MKSTLSAARRTTKPAVPPLVPGQRLSQKEFHRRYQAYPDDARFELVGGVVYMTSPLRRKHGNYHGRLSLPLLLYEAATPGVEFLDNATIILGSDKEPQPDAALRLLAEYLGQSKETADDYVQGAPELLGEVAFSTQDLDLQEKKADYQQAGVVEYLVVAIKEQRLYWFHFPSKRAIKPDRQGIYRSRVFPGLWIDGKALLARDSMRLIEAVQQGLASTEHAAFVKRLQARKREPT